MDICCHKELPMTDFNRDKFTWKPGDITIRVRLAMSQSLIHRTMKRQTEGAFSPWRIPADQNLHSSILFPEWLEIQHGEDAESSSYRGLNRRLNGGSDLAFFLTSFVSNSAT